MRLHLGYWHQLQDETKWETCFAATTDDQWEQMAAMVRQSILDFRF